MRRKTKQKVLAFGLAALLAASNVIPAVAAYGAPGRSTWQGSLNLDSPIMKRTMLTGKIGTGSEAETPTESADPSAPEESTESTESIESTESPEASEGNPEGSVDSTEESTEAIDETLMLVRASTFMITSEAELEPFFSDPHFRAAVFKAVKDGGDGAVGADVEEALANFTGDVKAGKKGITDITGIRYLRKANKVDLNHNEITDFLPAAADPSDGDIKTYYGVPDDEAENRDEGTNVYWIFSGNPFEKVPENFGGRLVIAQAGTTQYTYESNNEIIKYVRNGNHGIDLKLDIHKTALYDLHGNIKAPARLESVSDIAVTPKKDLEFDSYKATAVNVNRSHTFKLAVGVNQELHYETNDEYGTITPGSQSFKYYLQPQVMIYDRITVESNQYTGTVILHKVDADDASIPVPGAKFDLFTKDGNQLKSGLTTDDKGEIVITDLGSGQYYLAETSAPKGYDMDGRHIEFTVPDGTVALEGGLKEVTQQGGPNDGQTVTAQANEVLITGTDHTISSPDIILNGPTVPMTVTVTYSGILENGAEKSDIARTFSSLASAQADVNKEKNENHILGSVKIKVDYKKATTVANGAISVSAENMKNSVTITGKKTWSDDEGWNGTHPTIKIVLLRDGQSVDERVLPHGQTTYEFKDLPRRTPDKSHVYKYTLAEHFLDAAYENDFIVRQSGYNFANTHKSAKMSIEGTKKWYDKGYSPVHPDVTISLYQNDQKIDSYVIPSGKAQYHFAGLPAADAAGNAYDYRVEEEATENYICTKISGTDDFLNTYNPPPKPPVDPPKPPVDPPKPPVDPPSNGSHGGGGGGKNPPSPRPNVPPTSYGPGTTPPEDVPPTPGLPSETLPVTPLRQQPEDPDSPAPLPKTGEADSPIFYTIFWSASLALAGWYTMNQRKKEAEAENLH